MWKKAKLGEVCEFVYGKPLPQSERLSEGCPVYGANGLKTYSNKALYEKPSIIVGRKGSAGEINKVHIPFWALDVTYYVVNDENAIDLDFLYHVLKLKNLPSMARGVKPGINRNDIYSLEFPLPPLPEQQRIVAKLDSTFTEIDTAITATEKKQKEVTKLKQAILTNTLHPQTLPTKTWKTVQLGDICEVIAGQSPKGENYNKDEMGLPFYQGKKDYGEIYLKKPTVWTTKVTKKAYPNDILMSVRAPVGALNITNQEICIGRGLAAIRVKEKVDRNFIFYALSNIANDLTGTAGAIFDSINKKQIESIEFDIPSLPEQQRIVAKLDSTFTEIDNFTQAAKKKIKNYKALKFAILTQELQPKK